MGFSWLDIQKLRECKIPWFSFFANILFWPVFLVKDLIFYFKIKKEMKMILEVKEEYVIKEEE